MYYKNSQLKDTKKRTFFTTLDPISTDNNDYPPYQAPIPGPHIRPQIPGTPFQAPHIGPQIPAPHPPPLPPFQVSHTGPRPPIPGPPFIVTISGPDIQREASCFTTYLHFDAFCKLKHGPPVFRPKSEECSFSDN